MKLLRRCLLMLCLVAPAQAAELKVDLGNGGTTYSAAALLRRADARDITVAHDVAFKRTMHYRAVPLLDLLPGLVPSDHLQFVAADGFAAEIPASLLLNHAGSQPWLAIEPVDRPWPALAENPAGAGPFYLVWVDPQAARVSPEQWPYQLASIRRLADPASRFPAIQPAADVPADSPIRRGLAVFQRTCFACHTLNGAGDSHLGPDLNIPYNPVEYLRADLLLRYIRDPQSLRRWPQARMPGFDRRAISDAELDAVLAYLRHMAQRKRD